LVTLAHTLDALATAVAVLFAQLEGAVNTTIASVADAVIPHKFASESRAFAVLAIGTCPSSITRAHLCLGVNRATAIAIDGLAIDSSPLRLAYTLAIHIFAVEAARENFTAFTSETS